MSTSTRSAARRFDYRTLDLVTAAMLGVAFGVAYWGWAIGYSGLEVAFNAYAPAKGLLNGPWLLAGVVAGLVVRKPGAALLAEFVAANIEYLLGNGWGASVMVSGLLQGLGVELVLALFLYRRFNLGVAALAGAAAAALETVYEWDVYYAFWGLQSKLAYLGCFVVSGVLVAGVGGWLLVRALAETGALDGFAAGRERRDANRS